MKLRDVLIADDNVDLAENLREILEDEGLQVDIANCGESAIRRVDGKRYDMVLADLVMPGPMGDAVLAHVARSSPHTRMAAMTAYAQPAVISRAREAGAEEVFVKPLDVAAILAFIHRTEVGPPRGTSTETL